MFILWFSIMCHCQFKSIGDQRSCKSFISKPKNEWVQGSGQRPWEVVGPQEAPRFWSLGRHLKTVPWISSAYLLTFGAGKIERIQQICAVFDSIWCTQIVKTHSSPTHFSLFFQTLFSHLSLHLLINYIFISFLQGVTPPAGPSPPHLLDSQFTLLPSVLFDRVPIGKQYGNVLNDVKSSYSKVRCSIQIPGGVVCLIIGAPVISNKHPYWRNIAHNLMTLFPTPQDSWSKKMFPPIWPHNLTIILFTH